ncbi:MAG: zinc-finger domain-containing protein [Gammaproteobacteria bacterium]|jgi:uncharacterized Zn-finger protein|nr:hypothetical protein [Chromatiales bacterium]MCP4926797.1 zinc-finger domain-containing protein [Gammaproteobacteria bacterium]MDP7154247.1 zinc-finger domain-containing protein [Gammaproteobacteria bacterium]MDP7295913.1 zinc-finger domain-containing protein [Gammaproteobacteria bacterium]MDP7418972.1 zinc-finger domain-containing protein [Gammaproteobacteria bacterium]
MDGGSAGEPGLIQPNTENNYEVSHSDLPLSCPMPGMYLWNSHPKIFLAINSKGPSKCPYCGALYTLAD